MDDPTAFLAGISGRAGVAAARLLNQADLAELDLERLKAIFARDPLQTSTRRLKLEADDRELLDWLFSHRRATHALLIKDDPITLFVLNRPAIGGTEQAELELRALQRMVALFWARA